MNLEDLRPYLTDPVWFRREPGGIHGVAHVTRVLIWSAILVHRIGNPAAMRWRELYWAASTHDVGRIDDWTDPGHGASSADWAVANLAHRRPMAAPADLSFVAELCTWHEVADDRIERLSLELLLLKDADGLDRVRLGDLDPARLRTQHAARLARDTQRLYEATGETDDAEHVLETAIRLGIGALSPDFADI